MNCCGPICGLTQTNFIISTVLGNLSLCLDEYSLFEEATADNAGLQDETESGLEGGYSSFPTEFEDEEGAEILFTSSQSTMLRFMNYCKYMKRERYSSFQENLD